MPVGASASRGPPGVDCSSRCLRVSRSDRPSPRAPRPGRAIVVRPSGSNRRRCRSDLARITQSILDARPSGQGRRRPARWRCSVRVLTPSRRAARVALPSSSASARSKSCVVIAAIPSSRCTSTNASRSSVPRATGNDERIDGGRSSTLTDFPARRRQSVSMTFRSSRTFPGQSYSRIIRRARRSNRGGVTSCRRDSDRTKCDMSGPTSERRDRRGGTSIAMPWIR